MKDKLFRFFGGIRFLAFLVTFLAALMPVGLVTYTFLHLYESRQISTDYSQITSQSKLLSNQIASTGYLNDPSRVDFLNAELTAMANAYSGRIMVIDSSLHVVKDTYGAEEGRTIVWSNAVRAARGETSYMVDRKDHAIIIAAPIQNLSYIKDNDQKTSNTDNIQSPDDSPKKPVNDSPYLGVLLTVKSTDYISQNIAFYQDTGWEVMLLTMIFAGLLAFFFSNFLSTPLRRIVERIPKIRDDSEDSLPVRGFREARDIAVEFNDFKQKMQTIDASRSEFVSNVSHELKTPLASIKVLADSINSMGDQAPVEMYREFMGDITHEIDRETSIINDLLSLVKMDKSGVSLDIRSMNLNDVMESLLRRLRPLAEKQGVELVMESFRPVICDIDEVKFTLAIMNLVENAIKYNHEGGWVHVTLNSDYEFSYIKVKDSGMGIPEDSIDHIFERFYRVDKSHSREIGGTGLGLAITWNVIKLHHGEIKVSSVLGEGTTFDVRIPLKYIKEEDKA